MFRQNFEIYFRRMGKKKIFFKEYEPIYPRLITSWKWRFDYVLFEIKKKNGKRSWRNVWKFSRCNAWNVHQKYYIAKISQSKKDHIYLIARKRKAGCCMRRKTRYAKKVLALAPAHLHGTVKDTNNWKKIFFRFKTNQGMFWLSLPLSFDF